MSPDDLEEFQAFAVWNQARLVSLANLRLVRRFLQYGLERGRRWDDIDAAWLDAYIAQAFARYSNRSTRRHLLTALRSWLRFLYQRGKLLEPWALYLQFRVRGTFTLRRPLTVAQVNQVFETVGLDTPLGLQARAMLELAYACALRNRELVALQVQDLDIAGSSLTVRTSKNRHGRVLPIPPTCLAWLLRHLQESRPGLVSPGDEALFLSPTGGPFPSDRVNGWLRQQLGPLPFGFHFYLLRHSCATHLLQAGVRVETIAHFLGHRTWSSTHLYCQAQQQWLREVFQRHHPRATSSPHHQQLGLRCSRLFR